jgi:hypothetical protein
MDGIVQLGIIPCCEAPLVFDTLCPAIVLDYVPHITLNNIIGDSQDFWEAVGMTACLKSLGAAISALHQRALIHGDLKPSNILIHTSMTGVTVTDMGCCRGSEVGLRHTATPGFRSPETGTLPLPGGGAAGGAAGGTVYRRGNAAYACDTWAVGMVALCFTVRREQLVAATCKGDQDQAFGQWAVDAAAAPSMDRTWVERRVLSLKGVTMGAVSLSVCRGVWVWAALHALHAEPGQRLGALASLKQMQL